MELLWIVLFVFFGRWAWLARFESRKAAEEIKKLRRDLGIAERSLERLQKWQSEMGVPPVTPRAAPPRPAQPAEREPLVARAAVVPPAASPVVPPVVQPTAQQDVSLDGMPSSAAKPSSASEPVTVAAHAAPVAPPEDAAPAATAGNATATDADLAWAAARAEASSDEQLAAARQRSSPPPREPSPPPAWVTAARKWLFEGNLVAKIGLLILFIGVSFLLKYAAARVTVPIELRLAGIVLADIAALAWAWRIRATRPSVSLPLQGTCMAVLMLVTFGAFRMYHLIPGGLAFGLLFVLTLGTCLLAVLQNAQWLAIFGIVGGFAAPILTSTGQGSHIALFSYYALLNAGVLAIALKRSWRALNLLGFVFTFTIGTAWGVLRYTPQDYVSAQAFLALFFVYYVGIAIAYAHLQAPKLKSYVDGTLVFGTPMLAASLQFTLVKDMQFGMAFSALALGLFYGVLASVLARRRAVYGLLVDAFLALTVVFGTLAIPFALDGRWTSAAWALEGAGIVWIGLRQRQPLAWAFGLLVQLGAWFSFIGSVSGLDKAAALESNLWLGFLLLAASACIMATRFRSHSKEDGQPALQMLGAFFLVGAAVWLVGGAWTEILMRTHGVLQANLLVASALATAVLLAVMARRMAWQLSGGLAVVAQLLAGGTLLLLLANELGYAPVSTELFSTPVLGALMIMAGGAFSAWALKRYGDQDQAFLSNSMLAWSGLWWLLMVAPTLSNWLLAHYESARDSVRLELQWPAYCLLLAASTPLWTALAHRFAWPALRWSAMPLWLVFGVTTAGMLAALYPFNEMPGGEFWSAYAALWLISEWLMHHWPARGWPLREGALRALHTVRTTGPWLMIWPVAGYWISRALEGSNADPAWAHFLPAWLMMGVLAWTMRRVRADGWPVSPVAQWYRSVLVPLGCAWSLLLVAVWNVSKDGAMAPLPYVPLANPLDLTSAFALLLAVSCYRMLEDRLAPHRPVLLGGLVLLGYSWFNLALLRTVSNYLDVPYAFDTLFASQFVQAMLSLVWSITALLLMHQAARKQARKPWLVGAALLGLVVAKLFLVDLSNVGGVERIISFLGVGALMVGIGYLAPYPSPKEGTPQQEAA